MNDPGHVYLLWTRVPSGECNLLMHDTAEGEAKCRRHTARVKALMGIERITVTHIDAGGAEKKTK